MAGPPAFVTKSDLTNAVIPRRPSGRDEPSSWAPLSASTMARVLRPRSANASAASTSVLGGSFSDAPDPSAASADGTGEGVDGIVGRGGRDSNATRGLTLPPHRRDIARLRRRTPPRRVPMMH